VFVLVSFGCKEKKNSKKWAYKEVGIPVVGER
jgi:hypothetical protein